MRKAILGILLLVTGCGRSGENPETFQPLPTTPTGVDPYAVTGFVLDQANKPIPGARVEVVDGSHRGLVTTSDESGGFSFAPPFTDPAVNYRASRSGYLDMTQRFDERRVRLNGGVYIRLSTVNPPVLVGTYTLTFIADPACSAALPDNLRTRTYSARFDGDGSAYPVLKLDGAVFGSSGAYGSYDTIYFGLSDEAAVFYFSDPPIVEQIASHGAYLSMYGHASGPLSRAGGELRHSATFTYCPANYGTDYETCSRPAVTCKSQEHRLVIAQQ